MHLFVLHGLVITGVNNKYRCYEQNQTCESGYGGDSVIGRARTICNI